ncbi:ribbon-helix-helix domain-containing protein [Dactylosporangium siamense]|uniref:Ribbon-helix-helix protein CopG domain-containing protein n=1 Tax=Dactylosporangium siamense TaxID=685454 RepID=A0A919PRQ4_9ACTN|nr:ribbon-helix-helix domain-containing protein [Dactylosporangium siamense]GIG49411.1 hypothetical protein Dsi01nite_074520 [Dactylosporangium siamense]
MSLPDFTAMTHDEIADWLMHNDTVELMRLASAMPADTRIAVVDAQGDEIMKTTAFRMPPSLLAEMDEVAGNDREGRSGIVRRAVREYLDRHGQSGPAAA